MSHSEAEIRQHVKIYVRVFFALAALTLITVAISYLKMPLLAAVGVALFVATIKGSLVAAFFMHLATERPIILRILVLAAVFFSFLLIIPTLSSRF